MPREIMLELCLEDRCRNGKRAKGRPENETAHEM